MKKTLCLLLVLIAVCLQAAHAQLSMRLKAHYTFGGSADDISGYDNHGTLVGAVSATTDRFGSPDCAYEFDGDSTTYILVPYDTSLAYTADGAASISLWYKGGSPDVGDFECLFGQWNGTDTFFYWYSYNFFLALFDYNISVFCDIAGDAVEEEDRDVEGEEWHHVVGIYNDGNYTLYRDNVLSGSTSESITPWTDNFVIGRSFQGKIDDIRVYNRAITAAEIDSIFNLPTSCATTGMDEHSLADCAVYPNPTTGIVRVESSKDLQGTDIFLFDLMGRKLTTNYKAAHNVLQVDLSGQPAGMYVIQLRRGGEQKSMLVRKL